MVKNAIKTATKSTLNQIKANNINDITGIDRIVTSIGFKKASNDLFIPANIPSEIPRINEIVNPKIPLKIVEPIMIKKFLDTKSFRVVAKVSSGDGNIKLEL